MDRMKNELNDFFDNDTNKLAAVQVSDTFSLKLTEHMY